jgi:ectoine hydroxylase-related dioxygenase (phytanoyl-CoA dioxygenase family)
MIMKEPRVGGAGAWHQDYGYWYQNDVLFPLLTSASIAVNRATKENGCLQVLRGSHRAGRVDHVLSGEQAGADIERVNELSTRLELVYLEMEPRRHRFLRCQPAAPQRSKSLGEPSLVDDLLL